MLPAGHSRFNLLVGTGQKFCRNNNFIPAGEIFQRPPKILFTGAVLIPNGCIKKINSKFQPAADDLTGMFSFSELFLLVQQLGALRRITVYRADNPVRHIWFFQKRNVFGC